VCLGVWVLCFKSVIILEAFFFRICTLYFTLAVDGRRRDSLRLHRIIYTHFQTLVQIKTMVVIKSFRLSE